MVRVLHVITGLEVGGAERFLVRLLKSTRNDLSHQVYSLSGDGRLAVSIREMGIKVHTPGSSGWWNLFKALLGLRRLIHAEKIQVIQSWLYKADLFATIALLGCRVPLFWNVRQTNVARQYNTSSNLVALRVLRWLSYFAVDRIVYCAEAARFAHEELGYRAKLSTVISNGIDTQYFDPEKHQPSISLQFPTVVTVGRFDVQKGQKDFLRCAVRIRSENGNARFLMIGRGVDQRNKQLIRWINDSDLASNVVLMGERDDVPALLSASDVMLNCSHGEGFPNAVAEAMSMCVPVVATNVGDTADVVGDPVRVHPAGDVDALSEAVCDILRDSEEVRRYSGRQARLRIESRFSLSRCADQYVNLYHRFGVNP